MYRADLSVQLGRMNVGILSVHLWPPGDGGRGGWAGTGCGQSRKERLGVVG